MKKSNQTLTILIAGFMLWMALYGTTALGQVPESFNYQAVLRDASGAVKANTAVSLQIIILKGSATGSVVFTETHSTTTNGSGLINLQVGSVNTTGLFDINWSAGPYFIKVSADGTELGISQLLSVPYALHARTVEIDEVDDADADPSNELQTIDLSGSVLTLSNGGGTVTLPSSGGGDNWGTQTAVTDATLAGNGSAASPLKIAQHGATSGQALKWNGSAWAPATDETGSGGGAPSGPAGGDLSGTYPNPTIGNAKVTTAKIADDAVTGAKIADAAIVTADLANNSVSTDKIKDDAVTGAKIAQMSATNGKVLKWNGSTWAPAEDVQGVGLTLPFEETITSGEYALKITNDGTGGGIKGVSNSVEAGVVGIGLGKYGVKGEAPQFGVRGYASASSGLSIGVYGLSNSSDGSGVIGEAYSTTGLTNGVSGVSHSPDGYGVFGKAFSTSGANYGVNGLSRSTDGYGVYGEAPRYGVYGKTSSSSITNYAVYGITESSSGYGIYGTAPKYGVTGRSSAANGAAVTGFASGTSSSGVYGKSLTTDGIGVKGEGQAYDFYAAGPGENYGSGSSIRWKRNVMEIPQPLEKIKALRGVYFDWDEAHGGRHDVGMIAEEVGKVLPEIVVYEENGVDANGMDYSKTTPLLLEGIKALMEELEALKKENEQLKMEDEKLKIMLEELLRKAEHKQD